MKGKSKAPNSWLDMKCWACSGIFRYFPDARNQIFGKRSPHFCLKEDRCIPFWAAGEFSLRHLYWLKTVLLPFADPFSLSCLNGVLCLAKSFTSLEKCRQLTLNAIDVLCTGKQDSLWQCDEKRVYKDDILFKSIFVDDVWAVSVIIYSLLRCVAELLKNIFKLFSLKIIPCWWYSMATTKVIFQNRIIQNVLMLLIFAFNDKAYVDS